MRLIYLGSPYSSKHKIRMIDRMNSTQHCLAHYRRTAPELVLYSPIALWAPIANDHDLAHGFDTWAQQDFFMIRKSSALWILTIDGWKESYGLLQEIEYAHDISKPIMYVIQDSTGYVLTSDRPD